MNNKNSRNWMSDRSPIGIAGMGARPRPWTEEAEKVWATIPVGIDRVYDFHVRLDQLGIRIY